MYLIENGKAYQIEGDKAYYVKFDVNGNMQIEKDNTIDVNGKEKYSYDELYAKLNVAYMIEKAKKDKENKANSSEEVKQLIQENNELKEVNKELNAKLEELTNELETLNTKDEEVQEETKKLDDIVPDEANKEEVQGEVQEETFADNSQKENKKK